MADSTITTRDTGIFFGGTSGLVLPVPNKQCYPEEFRDKSRLSFYASLFNTIEVNSSFYKLPMAKTVARWAASVPETFQFTFKLSKTLTHIKPLRFDATSLERFMEVVAQADERRGCLLIQFPAGTRVDAFPVVRELLQALRRHDPQGRWRVSVEFRHASWYVDEVFRFLHDHNMNVVMHDIAPAPPFIDRSGGWAYFRFHGTEKNYRGSYSDEHLHAAAVEMRTLIDRGTSVYAYFNNTLGDAVNNLQTLQRLMGEV